MTQSETLNRAPSVSDNAVRSTTGRSRIFRIVVIWAFVTGGGLIAMNVFAARPGDSGSPARKWPSNTEIAFDVNKPNLFMFLHPMCPCSRASLDSLMRLTTTCRDRLNTTVVFVEPVNADFSAVDSPLYFAAGRAPGVSIVIDVDGREAERFGAKTSGQVMLYQSNRNLIFSGGITIARGHSGDNAGLAAVESWILNGRAKLCTAPVHGCPLEASIGNEKGRP